MNWFDIRDCKTDFRPINIIIGGRGIGKTYSELEKAEKVGIKLESYESNRKTCVGANGLICKGVL